MEFIEGLGKPALGKVNLNLKKSTLIVLCLAVIGFFCKRCFRWPASSLDTAWAGVNYNDHSGQVNVGATVYIYWTGVVPSDGTVDVAVIQPDGTTLIQWQDLSPSASGTISFIASESGTYLITFNGEPSYHTYTDLIAATSVFVLPESVIGALAAMVSGFAAVCVFGVVKYKNAKIKKD